MRDSCASDSGCNGYERTCTIGVVSKSLFVWSACRVSVLHAEFRSELGPQSLIRDSDNTCNKAIEREELARERETEGEREREGESERRQRRNTHTTDTTIVALHSI